MPEETEYFWKSREIIDEIIYFKVYQNLAIASKWSLSQIFPLDNHFRKSQYFLGGGERRCAIIGIHSLKTPI